MIPRFILHPSPFTLSVCLLSSFILHSSSFSQTSGQSVIDKKNSGTGFTREAFTLGNSQIIGRTAAGSLSGLTLGTGLTLTGTTITAASSSGAWADITGKPSVFPPDTHSQAISTITGLQTALDGKAAIVEPSFESAITITDINDPANNGSELNGIIIRSNREGVSQTEQQIIFGNGSKTGRLYAPILSNDYLWLLPQASGRVMLDSDNSGGIAATRLTSGTVAAARLGSGTASASTYLRGDGTWATVTGGVTSITGTANQITVTGTTTPVLSLPATITGLTSVTSTTFVGALTGTASGNATLGANTFTGAQTLPNAILSGLSLTGSQATNTVDVSTTWNTTGNPSLIYGRATNTASGASANLIDLGTSAGGSLFKVTKTGVLTLGNNFTIQSYGVADSLTFGNQGNATFAVYGGAGARQIRLSNTVPFGWTGSSPDGVLDVILIRETANRLAQRNGTTSNAFVVANTYTSTTNNEFGVLDWQTTTNTLRIGSSKGSGGGSNRAVHFIMGDAVEMRFDTDGNVILPALPTTAPATSGALWRDAANGNVLKVVP